MFHDRRLPAVIAPKLSRSIGFIMNNCVSAVKLLNKFGIGLIKTNLVSRMLYITVRRVAIESITRINKFMERDNDDSIIISFE